VGERSCLRLRPADREHTAEPETYSREQNSWSSSGPPADVEAAARLWIVSQDLTEKTDS